MSQTSPIGIFDSGIGGMSVVLELKKRAPHIPLLYVADTARFPYGNKSPATLFRYAEEMSRFLIEKGARTILFGCNAASSAALPMLAEKLSFPIIGVIEPIVQQIATLSSLKRLGIIGTQATVRIGKHKELLSHCRPDMHIISQACPQLAPVVERGLTQKNNIHSIVQSYMQPLIQADIDALLLACTHYSFLKQYVATYLPKECRIIDPAEQSVHVLFQRNPGLLDTRQSSAPCHFFVTGDPCSFKRTLRKVLRYTPDSIQQIRKKTYTSL